MCSQRLSAEAMWTFVLTVSLLCLTSEALVTCKNSNGDPVDWFIIYKSPKIQSQLTPLNGKEYIYMDSTGASVTTPNNKMIDNPNGILANTLSPLFRSPRLMEPTFGYISYSDQPPGSSAHHEKFGHSKGIVLVDRLGPGVWLMHSTPQFPYRKKANTFWPTTGETNAQTFICVTLPYSQFAAVGLHLQHIGAFPFDHDIPDNFHQQLIDAADWKQIPPPGRFQRLTTVNGSPFHAIAKRQSSLQKDGDLYVTIGQLIGSDVDAQTWGGQAHRSRSYCMKNLPRVYNVESIQVVGLGSWKPSCDHSKWCVARDQNKNWVCIADMNRALSQYERRGGALCLENPNIKNTFSSFVGGNENCNVPVNTQPCNSGSMIR